MCWDIGQNSSSSADRPHLERPHRSNTSAQRTAPSGALLLRLYAGVLVGVWSLSAGPGALSRDPILVLGDHLNLGAQGTISSQQEMGLFMLFRTARAHH
jgi:hypothetical protein